MLFMRVPAEKPYCCYRPPADYPVYAPGYYAVFFDDPINGIHWELTYTPRIPSLRSCIKWTKALGRMAKEHPEWKQ